MKKIVSAVALAAVAAGFATADVKTSINFRRGTNVFNNPNVSKSTVQYGQLGDITGTDAFTFKASNEYAGITLNVNPTSKDTGKTLWSAGNGVEYTGYMNLADWLQLKGGVHKDGIFYAEQVKKDTDDTNWSAAGKYAFLYKYGVTTKNSTAYAVDDLTSYQIGGTPFAFADFKFGVGGGNLLIRGAIANTGKNWLLTGGYENKTMATPGLMVAFKNDVINVNVDVQSISNNDLAAGVFVSPLGLADNALQLTAGFSLSTVFDGEKSAVGSVKDNKDGVTFYAIDLGVRYVAGDFHIANRFNFTGATEEGYVKQGASTASARTGDANIWDSLFLTFKLNDNWTITGNVQAQVATKAAGDDAVIDLSVTPGVMYTVGKGATITAGLYTSIGDVTGKVADDAVIGIALPVIFRIKL